MEEWIVKAVYVECQGEEENKYVLCQGSNGRSPASFAMLQVYIVLFIHAISRVVHAEMREDMSVTMFLQTFHRFASR